MSDRATILAVDDTPEVLDLLVKILTPAGYDVRPADSGVLALAAAAANPPDLVLLDIRMPDMDGLEVTRRLKAGAKTQHIPIILISADGASENAVQGLQLGAADYVSKPLRSDELLARIKVHLDLSQAQVSQKRQAEELRQANAQLQAQMAESQRMADELGQSLERAAHSRGALLSILEDHKRGEETLARERYLVNTLMDNTPDNIYFKDAQGRFLRINWALARYLRLDDPERAVGKTDADFFQPEHAQQALLDEQQILLTGQPMVGKEEKEAWPDGRETYVSTTKVALHDQAGAIVGTCGISRDITERKRAEEQLRQAQKMEALGQLAGGVAHDFNNLLTIIQGNAQFALESLPMGCAERDEIGDVLKAARSAGDLTRQLLAFSRRQVIEMRVLDLDALLRGMGRMLGRILGESVVLEIHPAGSSTPIKADPGQIEQVVVNLCVNARDAMARGGTLTLDTLTVDLDQAFVDARPGLRAGRHVMLAVSDTGCGMTPEVQARLFEPFFTTKEPGKGTGLGLATVYGIVQQCEGHIEVSSRIGKGSTFRIYLPCTDELATTETGTDGRVARGSETILVVDDDAVLQNMTARMLGDLGYRVLQAPRVADVVVLCRVTTDAIHLLLTDVQMPKMNGPELFEQLRTLRPTIKVLYMTGYTDDSIAYLGVLSEGVPLIQKPFSVADLARKVREVLDGKGEG